MTPRRRTSTKPKDNPPPKGLKIQLRGLLTIDEAKAGFHQAMAQLEAKGIRKVRATNIYTNPADEHGTIVTQLAGGDVIQDIVIVEPYRSAADEHGV